MFLLLQTLTFMSTHKRLMNLKTAIYILGVVLLSTFVSCLGDSDKPEIIYSTDAQITSFSIKGHIVLPGNDTIKNGLDAIKFSIDQINGEIFNRDSARFGLILPEKVVVTYSTASGQIVRNVTNEDSVWVKSGDSIDIRKPVRLRSFAQNGDTKEYTVTFNIYQVDPDSIWWQKMNSNLYLSKVVESKTFINNKNLYFFFTTPPTTAPPDPSFTYLLISSDMGITWQPGNICLYPNVSVSHIHQFGEDIYFVSGGLKKANISDIYATMTNIPSEYPVKYLFGEVGGKNLLALAVEKDSSIISATFDGNNWEYGDKLPDLLPTHYFSSLSYTRANTGHLTIVSGTSWGTTDGLSWTKIGNLPSNMQGANTFLYDGKIYLLNGFADKYNQSVYTSIDGTATWQLAPSKKSLPDNYTFRTGASVVVDSDNIIYIIGGRNGDNPVNDIWRGRLNRLN